MIRVRRSTSGKSHNVHIPSRMESTSSTAIVRTEDATTTTENTYNNPDPAPPGTVRQYVERAAFADGRMLSTYDVENMLITFMAIITGFLILSLIIIIMIRVHYKAKADELLHEMEIEHQAKKQKNPSPFAVPPRKGLEDEEKPDFVPVGKMQDVQHALYWKGDQVAAILHHAAMAPVIPTFEGSGGNVEIENFRNLR